MKQFLILLISLVSCMGVRAYSLLPPEYEGTMMPYDYSRTEQPAWSDTLQPYACVYVARHGARYMSGPDKFRKLDTLLRRQDTIGNLTADGRALLAMADTVMALSDGKWGRLSSVGMEEQDFLGSEMCRLFPDIGHSGMTVSTASSFVPRAMMTMYGFNHALMLRNDRLDVTAGSGHIYSPLVYFFQTDKEYARFRSEGNWREIVRRYREENIPTAPLERLFLHSVDLKREKAQDLVMDIYSLLQSRRAMGLSAPADRFMTADEYRSCWLLSNLTHYLRNCRSPLSGDLVPHAVSALVKSMMEDIETSVSNPAGPRFFGYFGHAETLMPLLSALNIPGCHAMTLDADILASEWKSEDVVPLGANLALFVFRTGHGTMAAVRLNGQNVMPIPGKGYLVDWNELKDYWHSIIR